MTYIYSGVGNGTMQFCNPRSGNAINGKWCLDNDCFNGPFQQEIFNKYLEKNKDKKTQCLFIVMPDSVGNPKKTMELWTEYAPKYKEWPLAFVAQDGQENLPFPPNNEWTTLFIGGSTEWKLSQGAIKCIEYAISIHKKVHIGRVNSWRRFKHFADLYGSSEFTCDGTKQRFIGTERAINEYENYQNNSRNNPSLGLSFGYNIG